MDNRKILLFEIPPSMTQQTTPAVRRNNVRVKSLPERVL